MINKKKKKMLGQASTWLNLSVIGIQFPVAILIGYWMGTQLDKLFGTAPYLMGLFSLFGIAAGFLNLFRMTAEANRQEELERQQKEQEQQQDDGQGSG